MCAYIGAIYVIGAACLLGSGYAMVYIYKLYGFTMGISALAIMVAVALLISFRLDAQKRPIL